jgi:hypothetical protein
MPRRFVIGPAPAVIAVVLDKAGKIHQSAQHKYPLYDLHVSGRSFQLPHQRRIPSVHSTMNTRTAIKSIHHPQEKHYETKPWAFMYAARYGDMDPVFQPSWVEFVEDLVSGISISAFMAFFVISCRTRSISSGWVRFRLMAHSLSNLSKKPPATRRFFDATNIALIGQLPLFRWSFPRWRSSIQPFHSAYGRHIDKITAPFFKLRSHHTRCESRVQILLWE